MTAITKPEQKYSREQIETIKATVARGASDTQLALFLEVCRARGLDPFTKQVYFTPQGVIVSIDGLRAIAERTGCYAPGPTRFEYDANGGLVAAHVTVKKLVHGTWHDVEEAAFLEEYRGHSPIWKKMPRVMLSKCSESRALRRAFSADLSGLYSAEEMDTERDITPPAQPVVEVAAKASRETEDYLIARDELLAAMDSDALKAAGKIIRQTQGAMRPDEVAHLRSLYAQRRAEVERIISVLKDA